MNIVNYMEEAVQRTLEEMMQDEVYQRLELDEKKRLDILAYALNRLPPKYMVSEKGQLFTRVNELKQQFKTDIIVSLTTAIRQIEANPR